MVEEALSWTRPHADEKQRVYITIATVECVRLLKVHFIFSNQIEDFPKTNWSNSLECRKLHFGMLSSSQLP